MDDDLEGETREECSKYGEVVQVVIYEIPSGVAVEEAVRIFVQFNRVESAVKGWVIPLLLALTFTFLVYVIEFKNTNF